MDDLNPLAKEAAVPDIVPSASSSPFEALRRVDDDGHEFWSARNLCVELGYVDWRNFADAVKRARATCANSRFDPEHHFVDRTEVIEGGRWGTQSVTDIGLSRYGAYLVAMNGDPHKTEIAEAQTYFATKTREAELRRAQAQPAVTLPDMTTPEGRRAVAQALLDGAEREIELTAKVAELEPKALAHDTYLSAHGGDRLVREVAKLLEWKERDLRQFLEDEGLVYRRQETCGERRWDFYAANAAHFRAVEKVVEHRWGRCSHYTLNVTPRGVDLIQKRIANRQTEMKLAIEASR